MDTATTQQLISATGSLMSGLATIAAVYVAYWVHRSQKILSQRQLIVPLWDHISSLRKFDPSNPIAEDAVKIVNALELVAICCEGKMIDEKVILRTFNEQFLGHYESIKKCNLIPGLGIDGEQLLLENRATIEYYRKLDSIRLSANRITP
ncbi:hypothetical protein IFT64_01185 [Oxalobacteraceae sp. CFBP 8753]|nr:hypothetical protein [Oxalobacteraceae sp. CFBP 8753]